MGKCKHHPQSEISSGGICSSCLQKKLNSVWRGESYSNFAVKDSPVSLVMHQPSSSKSNNFKEAISVIGSIASITKRGHLNQSRKNATSANMDSRYASGAHFHRKAPLPTFNARGGVTRGDAAGAVVSGPKTFSRKLSKDTESIMKDWAELHAKRRSHVPPATDIRFGLNTFPGGRSVGCRSQPLVDRIAKETALRVIKEVGEDDYQSIEELEGTSSRNRHRQDDNLGQSNTIRLEAANPREKVGHFSPISWHSKIRPKWVKGLGSPKTSSNKIFPSKTVEALQKLQAYGSSPSKDDPRQKPLRGVKKSANQESHLIYNVEPASDILPLRLTASEFSERVIEGMPDQILKPEDMNERLRTSHNTVLLWLRDLPCPQSPLFQLPDGPENSSLPSSDYVMESRDRSFYREDLTLVGHLHEIAEEHENLEEYGKPQAPQPSTTNHLGDVSSFGKFLIRAAQRQPKGGLSRVASAIPAR